MRMTAWVGVFLLATTSAAAAKGPVKGAKRVAKTTAASAKPSKGEPSRAEPSAAPKAATPAASPKSDALPVDCLDRKNRSESPACKGAFKESPTGAGPHLWDQAGLSQDWTNGYVDAKNDRLIVGGRWGTGTQNLGALVAVDLTSGNRKIISGAVYDPRKGAAVTGTGDEIGQVHGVASMPGGAAIVLSSLQADRVEPMQLVRVDLETGARTALWRTDGKKGGACIPPIGASFSVDAGQIATDAAGNVYVVGSVPAVGAGIFKITADGTKCSVVSYAGSGLEAKNRRGAGPDWSTASLRDLLLRDGAMYALDPGTRAIYKVDLSSGDREIVTRDNTPGRVGTGPYIAQTGFDRFSDGRFVTQDNQNVVLVDGASGNRTELATANAWGPTRWRVWTIPGRKIGIAAVGLGFAKVDFATGNANLFSN